MKTIEDIIFRIDRSIEEHERDIEKLKNEDGDNYGVSTFNRTLQIEKYKGMIYAYEDLKNAILRDEENEITMNRMKNRIRIFEHIGKGIFKLILDEKTNLEEKVHEYDYNKNQVLSKIKQLINKNRMTIQDTDCIIMINDQAIYDLFNYNNIISLDCIEGDFMMHFILWYRKEYSDYKFNGNRDYTNAWGILKNCE